jgi:hypothetical protein
LISSIPTTPLYNIIKKFQCIFPETKKLSPWISCTGLHRHQTGFKGITAMDGINLLNLIKYAAVLVAAIIIGNWFLSEVRKAKNNKEPWYKPYISVPGLIILVALTVPLILLLIDV